MQTGLSLFANSPIWLLFIQGSMLDEKNKFSDFM
jgi:hypothetical protein